LAINIGATRYIITMNTAFSYMQTVLAKERKYASIPQFCIPWGVLY